MVVPVWIVSAPFCGCATWSGWVLQRRLEPIHCSAAHQGPARTRLSPSVAQLLSSANWSSLSHNRWRSAEAQRESDQKKNLTYSTSMWCSFICTIPFKLSQLKLKFKLQCTKNTKYYQIFPKNRIYLNSLTILYAPTCRCFLLMFSNILWPLCRRDSM